MTNTKILCALLVLMFGIVGISSAQDCPAISDTENPDYLSYLNSVQPDDANSACIYLAIRKLGDAKVEEAIPALVKLLDFRRPLMDLEKQGFYYRIQGVWEVYPAAAALDNIGDKSAPALVAVIENPNSELIGDNALTVLVGLYKDNKATAVALLKQELDKTTDADIAKRLSSAIGKTIEQWCIEPQKEACQAAANRST